MSNIIETTTHDEVMAEVWRIKEALAAKHDFDVHRIAEEARQQQALSGRRILSPPPKRPNKNFSDAAEQVVAKNAELYQRLA